MSKRIISMIIILCIITSFLVACKENEQGGNESLLAPRETSDFELLPICRFPLLDNNENIDLTAYNESNLEFPTYEVTKNHAKENGEKKICIGDKKFTVQYLDSYVYSNDPQNFLSRKNFDFYNGNEGTIEVFSETGTIKKLGVSAEGEMALSPMIDDFSENSLRKTATIILQTYYGEDINDYLKEYYRFEYGRKITYSDSTLDRYVVSFRAYIQDIPTDDVIYIHFSTSGVFIGLSAQNYLQYLNYNKKYLFSKKNMDDKISVFLKELEYEKVTLRDTEYPYYYTINSIGELYYVTDWECISQGSVCIETLAIKAY